MWEYEYAKTTTASPAAIWQVLRDLDAWPSWDTSMERVTLRGPFEVGSEVVMKPKGQDPITSVIVGIVPNERYADETQFAGVTLGFSHTIEPTGDGGARIVHRLEITGPGADETGPQIGPMITEDFPEAMEALIARASS